MIDRRLKAVIVIYLWAALVEDTVLFVMAWLAPDIWFRLFHAAVPAGLETALLRSSAGQWAAFALAQAVTRWRWKKDPVWLAVSAGGAFFRFVHRRVVHPRRTVADHTWLDLAGATSFS
jgi:hypothetical protein